MKLKEINFEKVLWGYTPYDEFQFDVICSKDDLNLIKKIKEERIGKGYFYFDLWNMKLTLYYAQFEKNDIICKSIENINEDIINEYIFRNSNVFLSVSGHLPIDNEIEEYLKKELKK